MKRNCYVLFGLTEEDVEDIKKQYTGRRICYIYNKFGYQYALVTLNESERKAVRKECKKLNRKYDRKLELFTKEEFGVV